MMVYDLAVLIGFRVDDLKFGFGGMGFGRLGFGLFKCLCLEMRLQVIREEKARRERRARGEPETPTVTEESLSSLMLAVQG